MRFGFGIQDLGFGIWNSGFGIWDSGFNVCDSGLGVWDSGLGVWDSQHIGLGALRSPAQPKHFEAAPNQQLKDSLSFPP